MAILKKISSGKPPSPEDQAKLEKWSQGLGGSTAAPGGANGGGASAGGAFSAVPSGTILTAGDSEGGEVCPHAGHAVAAGPVGIDAYVAMAKAVRDAFGQKVPIDARSALFAALNDAAHPVAGGDIAVAMILHGHGSAAVVAAANGAIANPRDPVTANTLASALRGMKDYAHATTALAYARTLSPNSTTLANNLAWLAFAQGDTKFAGTMFSAAASNHKPSAQTLLGQGVIALCSKKYAQALPLFRQSLMSQWTDMAAAGVQVSEKGMQQGADGMGADIGSPDTYGPKGKTTPYWPDPIISSSGAGFAAEMHAKNPHITAFADAWGKAVETNGNIMKGLVTKAHPTSETIVDGNSTTFIHGYERQYFELNDIKNMIVARDEKAANAFLDGVGNLVTADGPMQGGGAEPPASWTCGFVRGRFDRNHGAFMALYSGRRPVFDRKIADLYALSAPIIASIDHADTQKMADAALNNVIASWQVGEMASVGTWGLEARAAYDFKAQDCVVPPPVPRPMGTLKNYPLDPNACKTPEVHMNFGIVNLNGDCEHLVLAFGELLQGSLDYKFGKDWGDDQLTVWAGAGVTSSGSLTRGAVTANASAGVYMTIGANGTVLDAGVQASAGVTAGAAHSSVPDIGGGSHTVSSGQGGANASAGVSAQLSLIDGPPGGAKTGDSSVSSNYGFTFGGSAPGE